MSEVGLNPASEALPSADEAKPVLSVVQTAGGLLSAARTLAGLSIEQVAGQLKLSPRQIIALENNAFEQLPKLVIVRGFVRSYAKLLKLDPVVVVACLPDEQSGQALDAGLQPTLATPFQESRSPFLGRSENNNRKYLMAAAFFAVAALLFVSYQYVEQSSYVKVFFAKSSVQVDSMPVSASSVDAVATSVPVVEKVSSVSAPSLTVAEVANGVNTDHSDQAKALVEVTSVSHTVAAVVSSTVAENAPLVQSVTAGNDKLRLKFRQDSWVQVKKENGVVLTSHLAKAGTEEVFDVKETLQLRLGNAAGVDALLRGNAMDITAGKDSNVVNLIIK